MDYAITYVDALGNRRVWCDASTREDASRVAEYVARAHGPAYRVAVEDRGMTRAFCPVALAAAIRGWDSVPAGVA